MNNEDTTPQAPPRLADDIGYLEDVAALADGTLPADRRAELLARLADDPDMLDVLAEVTAIQESEAVDAAERAGSEASQSAASQPPAKVLRGPWQRRAWAAAAALAATLLLVVAVPRLLPAGPPTPELMLASLDGTGLAPGGQAEDLWDVPVYRSGGGDSEISWQPLGPRDSFRLGLLEAALVAAVESGDDEARRSLRNEVNDLRLNPLLAPSYVDVIDGDEAEEQLQLHLEEVEDILGLVDPFWYRYGLWIRTAELAASSGQDSFFRGNGGRSLTGLKPPDDLVKEIRDLRQRVKRNDLDELAAHLRSLREKHAR